MELGPEKLKIENLGILFFVLKEGEGKRWRKEKGSAFCLSKVEIGDLESRFGFWHRIVKAKGRVGF